MNTLPFMCFLMLPALGWAQNGNFALTGTGDPKNPTEKIYLAYKSGDKRIIDSATVLNDRFSFKGKLNEPTSAQLLTGSRRNRGCGHKS